MAKKNGIAVVGMANLLTISGSIGYYTEMAADEVATSISFCQSDPMAVPYGGAGTMEQNPMSFAAQPPMIER